MLQLTFKFIIIHIMQQVNYEDTHFDILLSCKWTSSVFEQSREQGHVLIDAKHSEVKVMTLFTELIA